MILCVGTTPAVQRSLTFPQFHIDQVNRATAVRQTAAGKSINVAHVLTTLGKPVLETGFLGGDSGRFLRGELDGFGIAHRFVEVPFDTRICTTVIDKAAGTVTELVEESQEVAGQYWKELEELIAGYLPGCTAMILSGGLPPNAPQDFYAACCRMARPLRVPVVLDARGEPLRRAMEYRPIMVKPNRSELAATFDLPVETDGQLHDAIGRLIGLGTECALITMGAKGAVFSDGKEFWMIPSPKVQAVNPIGSGDAVTAGYAAGILDGLRPLDAAVLGIACGAANAMTDVPGVLHRDEVACLVKEIRPMPWGVGM